MLSIKLSDLKPLEVQSYLQHAIAPRPICFASTIDKNGHVNLSPYSFFNLFSSNPPIVVFSPARRVRDNTTKHTLQNILEVPEVVINIVDYDMLQQMSLTSCEYDKSINEFEKAGFTEEKATLISPPMVKESKIKLECKVNQVIPLGTEGGAGNLVIAEVLMMHIDNTVLNSENKIDQTKLDLVARLGSNWYTRANASTIFEVEKPNLNLGIGFDSLPPAIKNSTILSGNDLAILANVNVLPNIDATYHDDKLKNIIQYFSINPEEMENELHRYAKELLSLHKVNEAWQILLSTS
jgi:flavin reductase (DIM6/NTAB) family NADH-FMN oxidoreductase RutF